MSPSPRKSAPQKTSLKINMLPGPNRVVLCVTQYADHKCTTEVEEKCPIVIQKGQVQWYNRQCLHRGEIHIQTVLFRTVAGYSTVVSTEPSLPLLLLMEYTTNNSNAYTIGLVPTLDFQLLTLTMATPLSWSNQPHFLPNQPHLRLLRCVGAFNDPKFWDRFSLWSWLLSLWMDGTATLCHLRIVWYWGWCWRRCPVHGTYLIHPMLDLLALLAHICPLAVATAPEWQQPGPPNIIYPKKD